jgi:hypothetical protein
VVEARGGLHLAPEAADRADGLEQPRRVHDPLDLRAERRPRREHLQRHLASEARVLREVDDPLRATAELAEEPVRPELAAPVGRVTEAREHAQHLGRVGVHGPAARREELLGRAPAAPLDMTQEVLDDPGQRLRRSRHGPPRQG